MQIGCLYFFSNLILIDYRNKFAVGESPILRNAKGGMLLENFGRGGRDRTHDPLNASYSTKRWWGLASKNRIP